MKASTIVNKAKSYIGLTEYPANSNNVIFNTDFYGHAVYGANYPWCMAFVWDIFRMCGASDLFYDGNRTASCPCLMAWAKSNGQFVTGPYMPGDVLFFNFDSEPDADHTGICEYDNGSYLTTIEGNTSPDNSGSQSNGGGVFRRSRSKSQIIGAYRPQYESDASNWVKTDKGWRYKLDNGEFCRNAWIDYKGNWYYFLANGYMATDEYIKSNNYSQDKRLYYVDKEGIWNGNSYYWKQNEKGWWIESIQTGWYPKSEWAKIDSKWYYFNSSGYMVTGTQKIDGKTYTFGKDGALITK